MIKCNRCLMDESLLFNCAVKKKGYFIYSLILLSDDNSG